MSNRLDALLKTLNSPDKGKILLVLNALGMAFAALSNTFAAAKDKNTSPEDKKFLIPAGLVTGVANIGVYYAMTDKLINGFKKFVGNSFDKLDNSVKEEKTLKFVEKIIKKNENGFLSTRLFKKDSEYITSMKRSLLDDKKYATDLFENSVKNGGGVVGAFAGAIIGSAIITPIIRDVSAFFVQKHLEKKNPKMQEKPYMLYFDPTHVGMGPYASRRSIKLPKQPLTMKNYLNFTCDRTKI